MRKFLISISLLVMLLVSIRSQTPNQNPESQAATEQLIQLEREKDTAYQRGDKAALDQIYADDYEAIAANGTTIMKKAILDFFARPNIFELHRSEDVMVRVFGDVALVTGVQKRKFYKDIKPGGEDTLRYTNIYAKRNGTWQIVAAQFSPVKK